MLYLLSVEFGARRAVRGSALSIHASLRSCRLCVRDVTSVQRHHDLKAHTTCKSPFLVFITDMNSPLLVGALQLESGQGDISMAKQGGCLSSGLLPKPLPLTILDDGGYLSCHTDNQPFISICLCLLVFFFLFVPCFASFSCFIA